MSIGKRNTIQSSVVRELSSQIKGHIVAGQKVKQFMLLAKVTNQCGGEASYESRRGDLISASLVSVLDL